MRGESERVKQRRVAEPFEVVGIDLKQLIRAKIAHQSLIGVLSASLLLFGKYSALYTSILNLF